jgi:nitrogen regulatory protein PII
MSDPSTRLLVVVINDPERLDDVLTGLLELGVTGATIVDSEGMGRILARDTPVFAGLQAAVVDRPRNVTILSVVEAARVDAVIARVQGVVGDLSAPSTGIVFVLPVERVVGLAPVLVHAKDRGDEPGGA